MTDLAGGPENWPTKVNAEKALEGLDDPMEEWVTDLASGLTEQRLREVLFSCAELLSGWGTGEGLWPTESDRKRIVDLSNEALALPKTQAEPLAQGYAELLSASKVLALFLHLKDGQATDQLAILSARSDFEKALKKIADLEAGLE